jgi:hypothetical protein
MNLKNEVRTNEQITIRTQEHVTILDLEINKEGGGIMANLSDSRSIIIPLAWFKRLRNATQEQLNKYEISPAGCAIHWEELDEDISIKSFINGLKGGCCH